VSNSQVTPLVLRLSAMRWSQSDDGEDNYASTNELVIGPWLLKIEPGTPRLIRFGVPAPAGDVEATYRLFLEEQSSATPDAAAQLKVVMPHAFRAAGVRRAGRGKGLRAPRIRHP